MHTRHVIFFLYLFLTTLRINAADDIYFSKIGIEHGLSQLSVMSIYQDELGFMWFGTREGVSRYNGNSMEVIRPVANDTNSLNGNLVRNICGNKNGLVFIQSQNGINEYDIRSGRMKILQRQNVDAIAYGVRNLWVAENNKLYAWQDGVKSLFVEIEELKSPIRTLLQTSDQRIVVGTLSSGVYIIRSEERRVGKECR